MTKTQRVALWIGLAVGALALMSVVLHKHIEPNEPEIRGLLSGGPGFVPGAGKGDVTGVTAGSGLTGGGTNGALTINVGAGSGLTVSADAIDVAVGTGLAVSADEVTLNLAGASCSAGSFMSSLSSTGGGTCTAEPGDVSAVTAGDGLTGGGASGALTVNVAVGTGLSVAADAVNLNLTGATCSNGQAMTALGATGTGTCGSVNPNNYGGTHLEWIEEYLFRSSVANGANVGIFTGVPAGTGAAVNDGTGGTTTRPGIIVLTAGTTTTGSSSLQTNPQAVDFGSGSWNWQWTGGVTTLSTVAEEYAILAGFSDSTTINVVDGCYFLYDRGNVATSGSNSGNADKLSCWCAANSVRTTFLMDGSTVSDETFTTVDAPVAALTLPSTNIYTLEVRMTGTTRAEFLVNGVKSCNINTNIPSGASRLTGAVHGIFKSAGSTARTVSIDRTRVAVDLTTARTP